MKVNISQAALMIGKTRATLYRHIEKRGITVEQDDDGNPVIDVSELVRVYGDKVNIDTTNKLNNTPSNKVETGEVSALKKQIDLMEASTRRERDMFEGQIEHLKETLAKAQDGQNKLTLMLENQSKESGAGEWEQSMRAIEVRISNQEQETKDTKARAQKILHQNQALRKALENEKNKSLWKRLFG